MRVLYMSPYPPTRDGIGNYTWILANAVKESGAEIAVVVPRAGRDRSAEVIGALTIRGHNYPGLRAAVRAWNPDAIHVQFAVAAFGTRTLALLRSIALLRRDIQVPVVVTLHEYSRESVLLPLVGRLLHRYLASRCDQIVVHTTAALTDIVRRCGQPSSKVTLIPHPMAKPPAATSSTSDLRARFMLGDARVLLAFGFIHVDKGLDDLIHAVGIIQQASPRVLDDVRLVVAGAVRRRHGAFRVFEARDRIHLVRVRWLIRRHNLQRLLVMTGYVPAGEVAGWFSLADAVVMPYRRAEQSGVASLAQSFETPVIATHVGGLAEQISDTPWIVPPAVPAQLAEAIRRFLTAGPAERAEGSVRCHSNNDPASFAARTMSLYRVARAERQRGAANVA